MNFWEKSNLEHKWGQNEKQISIKLCQEISWLKTNMMS